MYIHNCIYIYRYLIVLMLINKTTLMSNFVDMSRKVSLTSNIYIYIYIYISFYIKKTKLLTKFLSTKNFSRTLINLLQSTVLPISSLTTKFCDIFSNFLSLDLALLFFFNKQSPGCVLLKKCS